MLFFKRKIRFLFLAVMLHCSFYTTMSQINYTANDAGHVPAYNGPFLYGNNMGYYGSTWDNITLSNIAAGNPLVNVAGVGSKSFRIPLPEEFVDFWGYDVSIAQYNHYATLGMRDNTLFVSSPSAAHRDNSFYGGCGQPSSLWANMFTPIWDGGANGTPVNDNNYYALYIYKLVTRYKAYNKFWEILNEPDYDFSGNSWKLPGQPGNWWENNPSPCDLVNMKAPIFHYIRLLRISYEVIKSVDPTAYITVGGIGYPSFLDAVLRNTDNPADGSVTPEYPLKGGAYFDVLSFHSYPMYNLRYWDNSINNFTYIRHSDGASQEFINAKTQMANVLNTHGYNNSTYPEKHFICTENNIPRKEFGDYIGSDQAQTNYIIKALVACQQNKIRQYYIFALGESKTYAEATHGYEMMGLYQKLDGLGPVTSGGIYNGVYGQQYTNEGIAFKTTSDLLLNYQYDNGKTSTLNLPATIGGGAFRDAIGNYVYVLWAKTTIDKSESASAIYTFPPAANVAPLLNKREWNYSVTGSTSSVPSVNVSLTATPIFLSENFQLVALTEEEKKKREAEKKLALTISPNPASHFASVNFTLTSPARVRLTIFDAQGKLVKSIPVRSQFATGSHTFPIYGMEAWPSGVYYCRFETEILQLMKKLVIVR